MKNMILSFSAVALAILLSAFSSYTRFFEKSFELCAYFIYDGSGDQCDINNYNKQTVPPDSCLGTSKLCWFKCCDHDEDGDIDAADFFVCFQAYDAIANCTLDDEPEISGRLDKRF